MAEKRTWIYFGGILERTWEGIRGEQDNFYAFFFPHCIKLDVVLFSKVGKIEWRMHGENQGLHFDMLNLRYICFYFILLFFNGYTHSIWKFSGWGLNPSHSCDLYQSHGNTKYFNPLCKAEDWIYTSTVTWAIAVRFLTPCITVGTLWITKNICP